MKILNCPLCGSDVLVPSQSKKVYCSDKECTAHDYGLIVETDSEGVVYLAEAFFKELKNES